MLARAGGTAPLHVHADLHTVQPGSRAYDELVRNMGRTRRLYLTGTVPELTLLTNATLSAPILSVIKVDLSDDTPVSTLRTAPFRSDDCPQLRELHLSPALICPIDFQSIATPFSNLASLTFSQMIHNHSDVHDILNSLMHMRVLEDLTLWLVTLHFMPLWAEATFPQVDLPSLVRLSLKTDVDLCLAVLPLLIFDRSQANLSVTVYSDEQLQDFTQDSLRRIVGQCTYAKGPSTTHLPHSESTENTVLQLGKSSRFRVEVQREPEEIGGLWLSLVTDDPDTQPIFELTVTVDMVQTRDVLACFVQALPISSVMSVEVSSCFCWPEELHGIFDHFLSAETLKLVDMTHEESRAVIESLYPRESRLPAPQLRKVILQGKEGGTDCPSLDVLRQCIIACQALGCGIERVVCGRNCDAVAVEVSSLSGLGIEVDWLPYL